MANKELIENMLGLSVEQIEKIAHNYLLSLATDYLRIEKFIKMFEYTPPRLYAEPSIEVRVKVTNVVGKVYTEKVYIHPHTDSVTGFEFKLSKISQLLEQDLLPNTVFTKSFEEAIKEKDEKEAIKKQAEFVRNLTAELNYNIKQQRKASAAKRSYKKYSIEKLESALDSLTDIQQRYLLEIIDELSGEDKPLQTIKEFIAKYVGAKKELFEQIEKSFEQREKRFFENVLSWYRKHEDHKKATEAQLQRLATEYVERQKWKLFKSVAQYLAPLDITSCLNTEFRVSVNGFEGSWLLSLADGSTKTFTTHTIIAEGLIQRAHYRYLNNLK